MNQSMSEISEHMREFGLFLLARGVLDATFSEQYNPYAHAVSVAICSQAAEILIKARIAQEHPLLIFSKLPKPDAITGRDLEIQDLFEYGRTLMFGELPALLWATTGYRMTNLDRYNAYGSLRNCVVHFGIPNKNLSEETYRFAFEVMEPMIYDFWEERILNYVADFAQEAEFVEEQLERLNISYREAT